MKNKFLALAVAAALLPAPALAQLGLIKPPSRVTVPASGAPVTVPYKGMVAWSPFMLPCGPETHEWRRDGADVGACSGTGCTVNYMESATTRGAHVARDAVTYWARFGMGSCVRLTDSASRTYTVQHAPTAAIVLAPTSLAVDEGANFLFSGSVDTEYAVNPTGTYTLDFGDGTRFASSAGYYFYSSPGTYVVTFTVDDGHFKATAQHTVYVYGDQPCGFGEELICQ